MTRSVGEQLECLLSPAIVTADVVLGGSPCESGKDLPGTLKLCLLLGF